MLRECTLYTSTAPCLRCSLVILAVGIRRIGFCVSNDVEVFGPILEDEGIRAFEYWGGEYHPLEELLEENRRYLTV